MQQVRSTPKENPRLSGWQAARVSKYLESIMTEKQSVWQQAYDQAAQVGKLKNKKAKSRQVVLLCETLKRALKGEK